MTPNTKRVFYVNNVAAPVYLEILATRPDVQVDKLANDTPGHLAEPVLAQAHAYQIGSSRQELAMELQGYAPLLNRCPNLLALSTNGAGFDTVSLADATAAGVAVVNQAGGNKEGVTEHVMAMMLVLSKRIMLSDHAMRRGAPYERRDFMGDDVQGRTIGVIGLGHVGSRVAELCRGLFRMRVLAFDPYLASDEVTARGAEKVATLEDLLRRADYVSVNCPHTSETRFMFGAAQFAQMRPDAYFITTALAAALAARQIAGVTRQSRHNIARIAAEQMLDILDGRKPPRLLNPEVWPAYGERFARILGFRPQA